MKLCPHCANPVRRGYKFCRFCGAKLKNRSRNLLFVGLACVLALVASLIWFLTYPSHRDYPEKKTPELLAQETEKEQSLPIESVQVLEETGGVQQARGESALETADVKPSKQEPPPGSEIQWQPKVPREEKTQQEVAIVKKESIPSSAPDLSIASSPSGEYETTRSTVVFAEPRTESKKITMLNPGTRVLVVGSKGDWLEVRSRHGRPPGFIRRDNAMFIKAAD